MKNYKRKDLSQETKQTIYDEVKSCRFYLKDISTRHQVSIYTIKMIVKELDEQKQVEELEESPKHPKVCKHCGGKVIFNRCDKHKSRSGYVYVCLNCHAWVGTSPKNIHDALGDLGTYELRKRRVELHRWFDKLWSNHRERANYYKRLAKELGMKECHFSQMSMEELDKAEIIIKKWWFEKYDR